MKTILKHTKVITTFILATAFIISTSGFSIYQHTCSTSQVENISLIIPAEKCDHATNIHNEQTDSCCKIVETATCCESKTPVNEEDCCHDQQEFKKLETDTVISQQPEIKALNTLIIEMLYNTTLLAINSINTINTICIPDPPPPPEIQETLATIQVYLI